MLQLLIYWKFESTTFIRGLHQSFTHSYSTSKKYINIVEYDTFLHDSRQQKYTVHLTSACCQNYLEDAQTHAVPLKYIYTNLFVTMMSLNIGQILFH